MPSWRGVLYDLAIDGLCPLLTYMPLAPGTFRVLTIVWALGWIGEFGLRVVMVETLSIPRVLVMSPIAFNGITAGLFAWTFMYMRHQRRRASSD